jgi:hypothetical protein
VGQGVCFAGGRRGCCTRGICQKYVSHNLLLCVTSGNLVVDTAQCRVTSYGDETLVTETDCQNNRTFLFFFILFRCRRKNNEEGPCTGHECLTEHGASVGQCF